MDSAQFRQDFPEFADTTMYPDSVITLYLNVAIASLPATRWGVWLSLGQELFTAHMVVLGARDAEDASLGITPGEVVGPTTAKGVDKVSVSYDGQAVSEEDAGFWNMTSYGTRFLRFARMCGTGGMQF
jgi:hypothetical protein